MRNIELIFIFSTLFCNLINFIAVYSNDRDGRLMLTPLIESGRIVEARDASIVGSVFSGRSYSGYFTTDLKLNTNLFVWFYPCEKLSAERPVLLDFVGAPGGQTIRTFSRVGPVQINQTTLDVTPGDISLTTIYSVIYIDVFPNGGFSYTDYPNKLDRTVKGVAKGIYNAMLQFFKLFPEYKTNDFYIKSVGPSCKIVTELALLIHRKNKNRLTQNYIKFKGVILIANRFDYLNSLKFSRYLFNTGLIEDSERIKMKKVEKKTMKYLLQQDYEKANKEMKKIFNGNNKDTLFGKFTGYESNRNFLVPNYYNPKPSPRTLEKLFNKKAIRNALHVGNQRFISRKDPCWKQYNIEVDRPDSKNIAKILNAEYKMLMFQGNLDMSLPIMSLRNQIANLKWKYIKNWQDSKTEAWKKNETFVYGYIKIFNNFQFAVLRNAGYYHAEDQPEAIHELFKKFGSF